MAKRRRRVVRPVIGWREWLDLPDLGIHRIKVKVDTGARTSSLHAFDLERFEVGGEPWVRFLVHPLQRDSETTVAVEAPLAVERRVRPSTGRVARRPVIVTRAVLGGGVLADRDHVDQPRPDGIPHAPRAPGGPPAVSGRPGAVFPGRGPGGAGELLV